MAAQLALPLEQPTAISVEQWHINGALSAMRRALGHLGEVATGPDHPLWCSFTELSDVHAYVEAVVAEELAHAADDGALVGQALAG